MLKIVRFSFLNTVFGLLRLKLSIGAPQARWISALTLAGLLMPLGILAEIYLGLSPVLMLVGGLSMLAATGLLGVATVREVPQKLITSERSL